MKNLLLIQPNSVLRRIYPRVLWNLDRNEKKIFLTFDDGPIPELTEWILDQLSIYKAKATFFCVGANIMKNRSVFDRIRAEGHVTGNHTMFHPRGFYTRLADYIVEAEDCRRLVGNDLFRPPYGQLTPGQYRELVKRGFRIVLWDVISYDYENISPKKCARNVHHNTRSGSIVLFHDNIKARKNVMHALPDFLKNFSEKGYEFTAMDQKPVPEKGVVS